MFSYFMYSLLNKNLQLKSIGKFKLMKVKKGSKPVHKHSNSVCLV